MGKFDVLCQNFQFKFYFFYFFGFVYFRIHREIWYLDSASLIGLNISEDILTYIVISLVFIVVYHGVVQ